MKLGKIASFCGLILPPFALIALFLSIQMAPSFNWTENAISDLGMFQSSSLLFNSTIIISGFLLMIFSIGLTGMLEKQKISYILLFLSSFFLIAIGIFPLPHPYHIYVSELFFISFPLSFLTLGLNLYKIKDSYKRRLGISALIIACIAIISPVFLLFFNGIAISEITIVTPGFIWCMSYSFHYLLKGW